METSEILDVLEEQAHGWDRTGIRSLLRELNFVQNYLFKRDCEQFKYTDPATGIYPLLATIAGTLQYEVPDVTETVGGVDYVRPVRKIGGVYVLSTSNVLRTYGGYLNRYYDKVNMGKAFMHMGRYWFPISARCVPATDLRKARIEFEYDPGATTTEYYYDRYLKPIQLTSENVPMTINSDDWYETIEMGVLGHIQTIQYGKTDNRHEMTLWNQFKSVLAPEFWKAMGEGDQSRIDRTLPLDSEYR